MFINKFVKGKAQQKEDSVKFNELIKLKEEHKKLQAESEKLQKYLDINVFDYAANKDKMEDIFEIKNPSSRFIQSTKHSELLKCNIPILEINNLTKYHGSKNVPTIINASLRVYLGDLHVIVGNYSSGKTTLFNCLMGRTPYEGEILVDGIINKTEASRVEQFCGFIPCEHGWDKFTTVEEVIFNKFQELELLEEYAKQYIRSSLEQFNLSGIRNRHIIDLSLLEIRKVQLAIALINDPHLIVFDQPLLGLQFFEQIELLTLIAKLKTSDRAVLIFSHSLSEMAKYANTITILSKGKIYYTGPIQDLLLTHQHKYAVSTQDNDMAIDILKEMDCKYKLNELKNVIYVQFNGKLNLLSFQKECASKNIFIEEIRPLSVEIEDLFPTLLKVGNKTAINEINKMCFFSVN